MKFQNGFLSALLMATAMGGNAFATVTSGTGGSGVTVGNSSLIGTLDYSDTFTLGVGTRVALAPNTFPVPAPSLPVENVYGNSAQSWPGSQWSISNDASPINGATIYPGGSGSGSAAGMTQTGGAVDYGITYGLRNRFVVQLDAVQTTDRVDLTFKNATTGIADATGLSVFFRSAGTEIGVYKPGPNETNTTLSGGVTAAKWNNYAVAVDRTNNTLQFFVNETSRGTVNLNTFAGGAYSSYTISNITVGGSGSDRTWTDNVQIGATAGSLVGPASLITYIPFNESSSATSTAFDQIHANNGTAVHTAGLTGLGAAAINGAVGNSVNIGAGVGNNFSTPNGITIEAQFTVPNTFTGATEAEFFRKEDGGNRILLSFQSGGNINNASGQLVGTAGVPGISFGLNTAGYKEMDVALDGLGGRPTLAQLADGREHYLAATYDAVTGIKALYLDGNLLALLDGTDNVLITDGGGAAAFIGSTGGGSEPFPGVLDEVAIYGAALSGTTIFDHNHLLVNGGNYFQNLTSLPEPGSCAVFGLVALAAFGYAVRMRRGK